jgi:hypothetical protein
MFKKFSLHTEVYIKISNQIIEGYTVYGGGGQFFFSTRVMSGIKKTVFFT